MWTGLVRSATSKWLTMQQQHNLSNHVSDAIKNEWQSIEGSVTVTTENENSIVNTFSNFVSRLQKSNSFKSRVSSQRSARKPWGRERRGELAESHKEGDLPLWHSLDLKRWLLSNKVPSPGPAPTIDSILLQCLGNWVVCHLSREPVHDVGLWQWPTFRCV